MDLSRRAFITGGGVSALAVLSRGAEARLPWQNRSGVAGAIASLNPLPTLTPGATFSSAFAGRGTLPTLDMSLQGDGSWTAIVGAKPALWDHITVPYGGTLEVTNVCGNGDLSAVQIQKVTFYLGANGSFNSVSSYLHTAAQQAPFIGAAGPRCQIQSPSLPTDSWGDLVIYTLPTRGYPDVHIIRVHFLGADDAAKPKVYVSNAATTGNGHYAGSNSSTTPTNIQTPFFSARYAAAYAAQNKIRQVLVDGATGVNATTLTSPTRTLNYPTVYIEDTCYPNMGCSNLMPVEVSEQSGGQLVLGKQQVNDTDYRSEGIWFWAAGRVVDNGVTWLCCNQNETTIGTWANLATGVAANGGTVAPNANINYVLMHTNARKIDKTADANVYNEIGPPDFNDTHWADGIDAPEISYLGAMNMTAECRVSNGGNLIVGSTFNQIGVDIVSTTSTNLGEAVHQNVLSDQSRKEYDRPHISRNLTVASVIRDTYNEYTSITFQQEQFAGVAKIQINSASTTATVECFVDDGTYSIPLCPRFFPYGANPGVGTFNLFWPANSTGPLAGKTPVGLPGFRVASTSGVPNSNRNGQTNLFTISITGLGIATTIGASNADANGYVQSGSFTFTSLGNGTTAGPYACEAFFTSCATNPSTVFTYSDTDYFNYFDITPSYNVNSSVALGAISQQGGLGWLSFSSGPGSPYVPAYNSPTSPPTLAHTPRVVVNGKTITGRGYANGGLTLTGAIPSLPYYAAQDAPAPSTFLISSTDSNGRTLVQCVNSAGSPAALPSSNLFYNGCVVTLASGQKVKAAQFINYNGTAAGASLAGPTTQPTTAPYQVAYSFYATPIGSYSDVTTPTAWSFADNMHGVFPNAQLILGSTVTTSTSNGITLVQCDSPLPPAAIFYAGLQAGLGPTLKLTVGTINNTSAAVNGQPAYSFYATPVVTPFTDVTSPVAWYFSNAALNTFYFAADYSAAPLNVTGINAEAITVDNAPSRGNSTVPLVFGQYISATTNQVNCVERFRDPYGVALAKSTSYGMASGDTLFIGTTEHPDDGQYQGTAYCLGKPIVNGFIRDRVISKGKQLQFFIGGFNSYVGPGTLSVDANGRVTINPGSVTLAQLVSSTAGTWPCYNNGNNPPDFVNTPANATSLSALPLYKAFFAGWSNFASWTNGWGNIRMPVLSGTLGGAGSLRLYAHYASGGNAGGQFTATSQVSAGSSTIGVTNTNTSSTLSVQPGDTVSFGTGTNYVVQTATSIAKSGTGTITIVGQTQEIIPASSVMTLVSPGYTVFLQDDSGLAVSGKLGLASGDTLQMPIPITDGSVFSVGDRSTNATAATMHQKAIAKLDPNNPTQPLQDIVFTRFAGQTGLTYTILSSINRYLERAYVYLSYSNNGVAHGSAGPPNSIGQTSTEFVLADYTWMQSDLMTTAGYGGCAFTMKGQCASRVRIISSICSGDISAYGNKGGNPGVEGLQYIDSIISTSSTGYAVTAANSVTNCAIGYVPECDINGKTNAIYNKNGVLVPMSTMPALSTIRYPFNLDGSAAVAGQYPGAMQPTSS